MTSKEEDYRSGFDLWKYNKTLSSHAVVWAENVIKFTKAKNQKEKDTFGECPKWQYFGTGYRRSTWLSLEYLAPNP